MPGIHPSGWLLSILLATQWINYFPRIKNCWHIGKVEILVCAAIIAYACLDINSPYSGGVLGIAPQLSNILLIPMLLYFLIKTELSLRPESEKILLYPFIVLAAFEAILAIQQMEQGRAILWESSYTKLWWWSEPIGRSLGTTEHGIELGMLFAFSIPLLTRLPSLLLRYCLAGLFLYCIPLTNGRMALIMAIIGVVFLVWSGRSRPIMNTICATVGLLAAMAGIQTKAGQDLLAKFEDDGGSAQLRLDAYTWASSHWTEFIIAGYQGNRDLRTAGLLGSSLDNAYLMAGLNFGLVFAIGLLAFQLWTAVRCFVQKPQARAASLAAVAAIVTANTSSSFMGNSVGGWLIWFGLGLAAGLPANAWGYRPPNQRDTVLHPSPKTLRLARRQTKAAAIAPYTTALEKDDQNDI